jgi:enoyl-CoA hydratase/carnithine racemase
MEEPQVLYKVEGVIAVIALNRPEKKNAFSWEMIQLLHQFFKEAREDESVKGIILTGNGDAFSAGGDVREMAEGKLRSWEMKRFLWEGVHRVVLLLEDLDKPVVAAVNGAAIGAGMGLSLMCDLRVCSDRARFAELYIKMGLVPGDGSAYFLPRLIGTAKALELLLSGEMLTAEQAWQIGIVNKVVPHDQLMPETFAFLERIINNPPLAVRMMKRAVYQAQTSTLRNHLDYISSQISLLSETEDHLEAAQAFIAKRKPLYTGK